MDTSKQRKLKDVHLEDVFDIGNEISFVSVGSLLGLVRSCGKTRNIYRWWYEDVLKCDMSSERCSMDQHYQSGTIIRTREWNLFLSIPVMFLSRNPWFQTKFSWSVTWLRYHLPMAAQDALDGSMVCSNAGCRRAIETFSCTPDTMHPFICPNRNVYPSTPA